MKKYIGLILLTIILSQDKKKINKVLGIKLDN